MGSGWIPIGRGAAGCLGEAVVALRVEGGVRARNALGISPLASVDEVIKVRSPAGSFAMKRAKAPVMVATFFGLFWCSITGAIDFVAFRNIYWQLLAKSYPIAPAHITHSEVVRKGKHKGVDMRYTFQVEGRQYQTGL